MIKILLDTNVILDALATRKPFNKAAETLFLLAADNKVRGFITANCVTDVYYVLRKNMPELTAREALRNLFYLFAIIDVKGADCEAALDSEIDDFEDALMAVCSHKTKIDYIVTRDEAFLAATGANAIKPEALLVKLKR